MKGPVCLYIRIYSTCGYVMYVRTYVCTHECTYAYTVCISGELLICDIVRLVVMDSGY